MTISADFAEFTPETENARTLYQQWSLMCQAEGVTDLAEAGAAVIAARCVLEASRELGADDDELFAAIAHETVRKEAE